MNVKRNLPTHLCALLLSNVALLALCSEPVVADATISSTVNANIRQHAGTLTSISRPASAFREERATGAMGVTHESVITRLPNRVGFWLLQKIGDSWIVRRISPISHMKLASDKKESAFKLLKDYDVDKVKSQIFESLAFVKWSSIFSKAFPDNPKLCAELMVSALAKTDEAKLIDSIAEAKLLPELTATAKGLESALIDQWLGEPNEKLIDVLKNPMVQKWLNTLPQGDPAMETLFFKAYARKGFEKEAADFEEAAEAAEGVVSKMAKSILGIKRANDEFRNLGLDKATSSKAIVSHNGFRAWLKKVKELGWDPVKLLLPKLKVVSSDKDILVDCVSESYLTAELRHTLQDAVLDQWTGMSGSAAFKKLGLDSASDGPFSILILSWASYMKRLFPETAPTEMVKILRVYDKINLDAKIDQAKASDDQPIQSLARDLDAAAKILDGSDNLPQPDLPPPMAAMPEV